MYIELDGRSDDKKLKLKAEMVEGELVITEEDEGWSVIALKIVKDKLVLVRHVSISDKRISTDKDGRIEEVPEWSS